MKATLDIPDDIATEVQRRAERDGRALVEEIVQLLKLGMVASEFSLADMPYFLRFFQAVRNAAGHGVVLQRSSVSLAKDPSTGLPVIHSPVDAPIHAMSVAEELALVQDAVTEEDLERAGLSIRH